MAESGYFCAPTDGQYCYEESRGFGTYVVPSRGRMPRVEEGGPNRCWQLSRVGVGRRMTASGSAYVRRTSTRGQRVYRALEGQRPALAHFDAAD
jgi:hypothetical protein